MIYLEAAAKIFFVTVAAAVTVGVLLILWICRK